MHKIRQFLNPALVDRHQQILRLTAILYQCLPVDFIGRCTLIGYETGSISIVAESPAWAARLRYHSRDILKHFQNTVSQDCRKVTVRVKRRPSGLKPETARQDSLKLPAATANAMLQLADQVTEPNLAAALKRLAKRANSGSRE